jgi:hypothetical protein
MFELLVHQRRSKIQPVQLTTNTRHFTEKLRVRNDMVLVFGRDGVIVTNDLI